MGQFAVGFPTTGGLSQKQGFPAQDSERAAPAKVIALEEVRSRERAPKSGWENAADLWEEALGQRPKGRLADPLPLADSGRPDDLPSGGYNIAFRFGVEQAGKLRACDDLKSGVTNKACRAHTPIKLVSWGHVSQLCRHIAADGRDWALFKVDHESAYKKLSIDPSGQPYAIVALRRPAPGVWHGIRSRT